MADNDDATDKNVPNKIESILQKHKTQKFPSALLF